MPPYSVGMSGAEEAGLGHRGDERLGVLAAGVEVAPVRVGEAVADRTDGGAEFLHES